MEKEEEKKHKEETKKSPPKKNIKTKNKNKWKAEKKHIK